LYVAICHVGPPRHVVVTPPPRTLFPDEAPNSPVQRAEAETKISITHPTLHYTAPPWACIPEKGLVIYDGHRRPESLLNRSEHTYIALPSIHSHLDHPSISRYHCILQYGDDQIGKTGKGWHIYDMGSTHGTKANKNKLPPKQHIRIRVGFVLQFGGSSRIFSLLGPDQDCESEWDCSPSEMREKMLKKAIEAKAAAAAKRELEEERLRESQMSEGIDWGMRFDEDTPAPSVDLDGHLMEDREQYYQSDPKKALAKFFEREGFDMTFQLTEQGSGHTHKWLCAIELPIEVSGVDRTYTAQAIVSTSKKDAQVQCALEACRILDAHGVLRSSKAKSRTKKNDLEANDFYDSDEDEYLDRTGQIERQREKRMLWAKSNEKATKKSTYESLLKELEETRENITQLKQKLDEMHTVKASTNTGDSLDDYCRQLSEGHGVVPDLKAKTETSVLRQRLVALTHDAQRLEKLVKIAKPVALPELKMAGTNSSADKQAFLRKTMMIGRKKASDLKAPAASTASNIVKGPAADVPFRPEVEGDDGQTIESIIQDDEPTNEIAGPSTVAVDEKKPETTQRGNQEHLTIILFLFTHLFI
uniref:FHA domain-containing protein n=1 Tax=Heligmosomoides polygyrus TaxID=6339 RepID=A0A8L8JZL2_HELPZ